MSRFDRRMARRGIKRSGDLHLRAYAEYLALTDRWWDAYHVDQRVVASALGGGANLLGAIERVASPVEKAIQSKSREGIEPPPVSREYLDLPPEPKMAEGIHGKLTVSDGFVADEPYD